MKKSIAFALIAIFSITSLAYVEAKESKAEKYNIGEIDIKKLYQEKQNKNNASNPSGSLSLSGKDQLKKDYLNKFLKLEEDAKRLNLTTNRKIKLRNFYIEKIEENKLLEKDEYILNPIVRDDRRHNQSLKKRQEEAEYYWIKSGDINDETYEKELLGIKVDRQKQARESLQHALNAALLDHEKAKIFMSLRAKQLYETSNYRYDLENAYTFYLFVKDKEAQHRLGIEIDVENIKRKLKRYNIYDLSTGFDVENKAYICLLSDYRICKIEVR